MIAKINFRERKSDERGERKKVISEKSLVFFFF